MAAFCVTVARKSGPRQGVNVRRCVSTRELTARPLLLRVVRRPPPAKPRITTDPKHNGRSVYVSRSVEAVQEARRRRKLSASLRADVPPILYDQLEREALACETSATSLGAADAFARAQPLAPVDEVVEGVWQHDSVWE